MEYLGYIQISEPNSKKKTVSIKPTPHFKLSDALKLFGFLYRYKEVTYFYDSQYNNRTNKYH